MSLKISIDSASTHNQRDGRVKNVVIVDFANTSGILGGGGSNHGNPRQALIARGLQLPSCSEHGWALRMLRRCVNPTVPVALGCSVGLEYQIEDERGIAFVRSELSLLESAFLGNMDGGLVIGMDQAGHRR
jgi:hypothetical protein